jgi:hypothetical protein
MDADAPDLVDPEAKDLRWRPPIEAAFWPDDVAVE